MKLPKALLFGLIYFQILCVTGQTTFQRGHYVLTSGEKVESLIKNKDWGTSPTEIIVKSNASSPEKVLSVNEITSFEIYDYSRYERHEVQIDLSSSKYSDISKQMGPEWETKLVMLNVLIAGKYNLLEYKKLGLTRYFVSSDDELYQLIFKKYSMVPGKILTNNAYRQQIKNLVRCEDYNVRLTTLDYSLKDLTKAIEELNKCENEEFHNYHKNRMQSKKLSSLRIVPGFSINTFSMNNPSLAIDFDRKTNFRLGIEYEYLLPTNNDSWALVVEPNYQYFNSNGSTEQGIPNRYTINYSSIVLPLGVRRYFSFQETKLFVNGFLALDFDLNSKIEGLNFDVRTAQNFGIGFGIRRSQYGLEVRYYTNRNLIIDRVAWDSEFRKLSILFSMKIL